MTYDPLKRLIDIVVAAAGLVLLSPLQVLVAWAVRRNLGKPVLFRQQRPGRDGETFELLKFRSMVDPDPEAGLLSDADRLTGFGRALRSTSLDELPTLVNVLRGDMSLVGPRPLLVDYLPLYSPAQARRHEVRPGITGLAQVSGRNALTWVDKLALDVEYVDTRSLRLDLIIIARTFRSTIKREGISAAGHATIEPFTGPSEGTGS